MSQLVSLSRFPVKGLGPSALTTTRLEPGATLPHDRAYAIENGPGPFDPANPTHVKKKHFLALVSQAELAELTTRHDPEAGRMIVQHADGDEVTVVLDDASTHGPFFRLLERLLGDRLRGPMRLVHAPGQAMTDIPEPHLSLINAASVRALSEQLGQPLDPLRFRGNLVIDGLEPWAEFDWIGRTVRIGEAVLTGERRIRRCAATSVDPDTGRLNGDVPAALFEHYGHMDCGLYLSVSRAGRVALGDPVAADGA